MVAIISPAKSLDFSIERELAAHYIPRHLAKTESLIKNLRKLSVSKIKTLMSISQNLAELNKERYQTFDIENPEVGKAAILVFKGDVYQGFAVDSLSDDLLNQSDKHLRILSGLYGLLRPQDVIQPYRLEMGTRLDMKSRGKNLYEYWKKIIGKQLQQDIEENNAQFLINLASNEYFKAVDASAIKVPIVNVDFKDAKNGEYKMISFFAKKARGMMARYIVENGLTNADDLKGFDTEGYYFSADLSNNHTFTFLREENKK